MQDAIESISNAGPLIPTLHPLSTSQALIGLAATSAGGLICFGVYRIKQHRKRKRKD